TPYQCDRRRAFRTTRIDVKMFSEQRSGARDVGWSKHIDGMCNSRGRVTARRHDRLRLWTTVIVTWTCVCRRCSSWRWACGWISCWTTRRLSHDALRSTLLLDGVRQLVRD